MLIAPAIDLLEGRAVRLVRGRREAARVFSERPWELLEGFARAGARLVHVVSLDGAFAGRPPSTGDGALARVLDAARYHALDVQLGGGLRTADDLAALFEHGVYRAVLGTAAAGDPDFVRAACRRHPGRVVVAVDERDGQVAVAGWTATSGRPVHEVADEARTAGAAAVLHTVIERDGTREGPAVAASAALQRRIAPLPVIASGGVGTLEHVGALRDAGVAMAVVGTAIYDGSLDLAAAVALAAEPAC